MSNSPHSSPPSGGDWLSTSIQFEPITEREYGTLSPEVSDHDLMAEEFIDYGPGERAILEKRKKKADSKGEDLINHYRLEEPRRESLRVALQQFQQQDEVLFLTFRDHLHNAHIISPHEVRRYDIISWFTSGLPDHVKKPLKEVQEYYHKETCLRYEVAVLEGRERSGIDDWSEELDYAVSRYGKAHYGYETLDRPNGHQDFKLRFEGKLQLRHILAGLEARVVRLDHAAVGERHGKQSWENCLDRKVLVWMEAAEGHFRRRFSFLTSSAANEYTQPPYQVTQPEDVEVYKKLQTTLSQRKQKLKDRKMIISELRSLRAREAKKAGQFTTSAIEDKKNGVSGDSTKTGKLREEMDALARRMDGVERRMTQWFGERSQWDWEEG